MSTISHPQVSIVTVTYNSEHEIIQCVESIQQSINVSTELIIIDNVSVDKTREIISKMADDFSNVQIILNQENFGLAKANNQCIDVCTGDYVLILNPDTVIDKNAISGMVSYLEKNPDVGVVGCQNVFEDGKPHTS